MSTTPTKSFVGWHRHDRLSKWRAVVSGETEDEVYRQLLSMVRGGNKVILPTGQDPNITLRVTPVLRRHSNATEGVESGRNAKKDSDGQLAVERCNASEASANSRSRL
jgi:hypothetical protein